MGWAYMDADDLWRMLGWEFSLIVATVRLINSGLLDELPSLKIQVSHFGGGIARYLPRIRGLQNREKSGTAKIPRHCRMPREPFDHYLQHRLFYDCAGWSGPDYAAERGAEWVRVGLTELPSSQVLFATDYPQAVRDDDEVVAYVKAVSALGSEAPGRSQRRQCEEPLCDFVQPSFARALSHISSQRNAFCSSSPPILFRLAFHRRRRRIFD